MTSYLAPLQKATQTFAQDESVASSQNNQFHNLFRSYALHWRRDALLVSITNDASAPLSASDQKALVTCLKRSPIKKVYIELDAGEEHLKIWADACKAANKSLHLRVRKGVNPSQMSPNAWFVKRGLDWFAALGITVVLSPIFVSIAAVIKLTSPGSIFYRQWRVGKQGQLFQVWKFRTMVSNAEVLHHKVMGQQEGLHKQENDPRITSIGKFLRKYSLDEFPQLINVLQGDMSLVGPRPWAIYDALRVPVEGRERLQATPGMTGEWQVSGRSDLRCFDAVNKMDLDYLKGWSLARDFKLLLRTILKVLFGSGAY